MMQIICENWPIFVVANALVVAFWALDSIAFQRGRLSGRAEVYREQRHAQKERL